MCVRLCICVTEGWHVCPLVTLLIVPKRREERSSHRWCCLYIPFQRPTVMEQHPHPATWLPPPSHCLSVSSCLYSCVCSPQHFWCAGGSCCIWLPLANTYCINSVHLQTGACASLSDCPGRFQSDTTLSKFTTTTTTMIKNGNFVHAKTGQHLRDSCHHWRQAHL